MNANQTSYPTVVHWTNANGAYYHDLYRYDYETAASTYLGQIASSAHTYAFNDALPMDGTSGDFYYYYMYSYDSSSNYLGEDETGDFEPVAYDDANSAISYSHGTWLRTNVSGTTKGHYTHSTSHGATATFSDCMFNIGLVVTTSSAGGTANLLQNGVVIKKLSFKSSSTTKRVLIYKNGWSTDQCNTYKLVQLTGQINVDTFQVIED